MAKQPTTKSELAVPQTPELQKATYDIVVAHQIANRHAKDAVMYALWCGKRLRDVQNSLGKDGVFGAWLEQNLVNEGISRRTAFRYMAIFDRLSREQQKALPEISTELVALEAPAVPSASLTGVYREYGMVKPTVHKPSSRPLTPRQALGGLTRFSDRIGKTDFSRLSAADRAKLRAAAAKVLELIDAAAPAKAAA